LEPSVRPALSVLDILRTELRVAMQQIGAPSLKDLKPS
jgi:isopentenyl diphosphate isomerase/L-lactate dehydrogenase-like FMN-dependent dehydrogenase